MESDLPYSLYVPNTAVVPNLEVTRNLTIDGSLNVYQIVDVSGSVGTSGQTLKSQGPLAGVKWGTDLPGFTPVIFFVSTTSNTQLTNGVITDLTSCNPGSDVINIGGKLSTSTYVFLPTETGIYNIFIQAQMNGSNPNFLTTASVLLKVYDASVNLLYTRTNTGALATPSYSSYLSPSINMNLSLTAGYIVEAAFLATTALSTNTTQLIARNSFFGGSRLY